MLLLVVAIWVVFFMTTMRYLVPALELRITPNISEIWRTADKPIGTEINRSITARHEMVAVAVETRARDQGQNIPAKISNPARAHFF